MSQSLARVLLHLVFSTKNREALIVTGWRPQLHAYLVGTIEGIGCIPIAAGGTADHVHLLFALARTLTIAEAVESLKTGSSKWCKTQARRPSPGRPDMGSSPSASRSSRRSSSTFGTRRTTTGTGHSRRSTESSSCGTASRLMNGICGIEDCVALTGLFGCGRC